MKKVVIIGAKGNLGGELVRTFEVGDYDVTSWDREEIDITDKELISKKMSDINPDIIINAAAYNAVDKCEEDDDAYEIAKNVNIDGPRNLALAALETNSVIIHFSSDYVFDGEKKGGYTENDEVNPISRYGKTKKYGEKAIIELSAKGLKWYLIRTSKLFGTQGESEAAKPSFFDLILGMSKTRKEFNMVDGEEISCFTYTKDLAEAVKTLVDDNYGNGIYHIVNEEPDSWYGGSKYMFELKGVKEVKLNPVKTKNYSRPAKRPMFSILLNTKFPKLRSYKEALKEYLNQD